MKAAMLRTNIGSTNPFIIILCKRFLNSYQLVSDLKHSGKLPDFSAALTNITSSLSKTFLCLAIASDMLSPSDTDFLTLAKASKNASGCPQGNRAARCAASQR